MITTHTLHVLTHRPLLLSRTGNEQLGRGTPFQMLTDVGSNITIYFTPARLLVDFALSAPSRKYRPSKAHARQRHKREKDFRVNFPPKRMELEVE
jgi:hypothetical protein